MRLPFIQSSLEKKITAMAGGMFIHVYKSNITRSALSQSDS